MWKKILLGLLVVIGIFAVVVAMQPSDYQVTRSATMAAPPSEVFAQVNDFHKWEAWSPWAKLDPSIKMTFEGPAEGAGAIYKWTGNDKVGEGMMKINESKPAEQILIKLDFIKPFESSCDTDFTFKPEGSQTVVTWTMSGKNNFIGKAMCLFMNMDKMVGGDFEKGLANMKAVVEGEKK
ncbi:SRPBCC family protein [Zavarzinella formosa]|uniref:SRPBCC family protein n=1 Tax=Zavarzinella formosa TaxID=360055 RepID=UPI0002DD7C77|nr:SRPBCC family protein [Zavarzinella formosa]